MSTTELPVDDRGRIAPWWHAPAGRALTALFLVATAATVAVMLRGQDWSALGTSLRSRPAESFAALVGLAILANAAALLAAMLSWWSLLSGVSAGVTVAGAARVFFVGQFAKYLPGKVFALVVSVRMGRAMNVSALRMTSAWLLTLVIGLLTGATVGLAAGPRVLGGSVAWLVLAALPIVAVVVRPGLIGRAAVLVARLRRRPAPDTTLPGHVLRRSVLSQLVSWLAGGLHLWFLAVAMGADPAGSFLLCVGVFSLATVAGMFAVFTPEGLGVREVLLLGALSLVLPLPAAGVVALVSRLVAIASELVTAGVGLAVTEWVRRRPTSGQDLARTAARHHVLPVPRD